MPSRLSIPWSSAQGLLIAQRRRGVAGCLQITRTPAGGMWYLCIASQRCHLHWKLMLNVWQVARNLFLEACPSRPSQGQDVCSHRRFRGFRAPKRFCVVPPREHLTMSASVGHMAQHGTGTTLSSLGQPAILSPTPSKTPSFGGSDSNPGRMLESAHASQLGSGSVRA